LYSFSTEEAIALKNVCTSLANGCVNHFELTAEPWVKSADGCQLDLSAASKDYGIRPHRIGVFRRMSRTIFHCDLTPQSWSRVADIVEPFCFPMPNADSCHQWLDETGPISLLLSPSGGW
jgi:hypothetical protein